DGHDYSEVTNSHYVAIENSKPIINIITPEPGSILINETDSLDFSVEATDPDGDLLLIKWRLDKTTVSDSEYYLFETDHKSNGSYDLNLTIQDIGKNSFTLSYIWKITVRNTNRLPEVEVREPIVKDPKVIEDTPLKFLIVESDPDDDDTLTINWYIDEVHAQTSGSSFSYTPVHADVGERVVKIVLTDGTDTVEYSWNLTVEPKQVKEEEKGPLGLDWDVWGILMEIIVVSATGVLAFIGYRRLRKKKGALKIYLDEIEEIAKLKDKDPSKYETKLNDLEERINTEFREGNMEDLHFLMLQELIASKRGEHRRETVSRKFRSLPQGIAKNLDEMLEDGKISRDEYMAFATTMKESKSLTPFEKRELSKMISKWEVEDKGTVSEDPLTKKLKPKEKVEMAEWEDDDNDWDKDELDEE
ncbi:MAG: hypothetical protein KAJ51_06880, partial [Thermoplasmata archaeon]|nr:hypothetical protein [Thermoplasmata archaeon]